MSQPAVKSLFLNNDFKLITILLLFFVTVHQGRAYHAFAF
jgi:hypothetical protein